MARRGSLCVAALLVALVAVARADPGEILETIGGSVDGGPVCKLALLAPFQGALGELGNAVLSGVKLSIADFNSKERAVEVTVYDSNCNAEDAQHAFEDAAAMGVVGIIGEVCSGASLAVAELANKMQIPMISPSSTSPRLTIDGGKYFNRVVPSDVYQGQVGAMLVASMGYKKVAIIYSLDAYGESIAHELFGTFSKSPVSDTTSVVAMLGFSGEWETGNLVGLQAADPDALILTVGSAGAERSQIDIVAELRGLGWEGQVFGTDTLTLNAYLQGEDGDVLDGAYGLGIYVGVSSWQEKYKEAYDVDLVPQFAATAYDVTKIFLKNCLSDKGVPLSGAAIQAKIVKPYNNQVMLNGALGRVVFDKYGDITEPKYSTFEAKNGTWELITDDVVDSR